jgi:glycosyltransferase involved in cell wall biosynthesis
MKRFRRGIDPDLFTPTAANHSFLRSHFGITGGINLLHCGRVSKEKNVDFLAEVYEALLAENQNVNLIMAGDGPYLEEFRQKMRGLPKVHFAGRLSRPELPKLYASCDMLVFPSVTETFGLVVLEAQACGLPAIVSNFGGPQEIIINEKTGFIAQASNLGEWKNKIQEIMTMIACYPELYQEMRFNSRNNAIENFSWDLVLKDVFARSVVTPSHDTYNPFGDIIQAKKSTHA